MSYGLRLRDDDNNIIMDTSTRVCRVLGVSNFTAGVPGSITNAGFSGGSPWWTVLRSQSGAPIFSIDGNTLSWAFPSDGVANTSAPFVYGIY